MTFFFAGLPAWFDLDAATAIISFCVVLAVCFVVTRLPFIWCWLFRPRFRRYMRANRLFSRFVATLGLTPEGPTAEQRHKTLTDSSMKAVEAELIEVAADCQKASAHHDRGATWLALGMLYNMQGRHADAVHALNNALEAAFTWSKVDASDPTAWRQLKTSAKILVCSGRFELGFAHLWHKEYQKAKEEFQQCLAIDSDLGAHAERQELCRNGIRKCEEALQAS